MTTKLDATFDTAKEEGSKFDPLPAGKYNADLMDIKVEDLRSGKGQAVVCSWCVWDGDFEGRYVWDRIIIQHESEQAMRIGRAKFKDLVVACGILDPIDDVAVLKDARCTLQVKIEVSEEYGDRNRVTRVLRFTPKPGNSGTIRAASTIPASGKPENVPFNDDLPY